MLAELDSISHERIGAHKCPVLDGRELRILKGENISEDTDFSNITAAIGIATVLYSWCPDALRAFLDTELWLSMTWNLTIRQGQDDEVKFEIGRIRSQVTFGKLDNDGLWELMLTYEMPETGGSWVAVEAESMIGEENIEDVNESDRLARSFIRELLLQKVWSTGPKTKHQFFIEAINAPMDPFSDGLAIDPRWLYKSLDLSRCTACNRTSQEGITLSRCGKCGTAAYCSSVCQRGDWSVHKATCTMSMIDRGKALHLSKHGGLISCDWSKGIDHTEETDGD